MEMTKYGNVSRGTCTLEVSTQPFVGKTVVFMMKNKMHILLCKRTVFIHILIIWNSCKETEDIERVIRIHQSKKGIQCTVQKNKQSSTQHSEN